MIKITIDGDEVYSAKDFTIKEEMLNTPSVILNNVYPISWEQDRDYVSRFYHPNDYSKCLIMNNTHIPEEPGITVTSTSINADVDTSKKYEYALMGDTQQGLPSGYTQVDYIESSRTQYIDTGVNADSNLRVLLDMAYSDTLSTSNRAMIGAIRSANSTYVRYHLSLSGGGAWQAYFVNTSKTWGTSDLNRHVFDFDAPRKKIIVDGEPSGSYSYTSFDTQLNFWLFGRNSNVDNLKGYNATKIYNAKFYYNGTLVRNFVPCLNSSNVAGLYDTVEGKFYENNGTGTFVYGSVAPNPNTPVAIDTVTGGQTIKIEGKNLFDKDNANLLSAYTSSTIISSATSKTLYIPCNPNTTYTISRQLVGKRFQAGTTSEMPNINVAVSDLTPSNYANQDSSITLTTNANAKYLVVFYSNTGGGSDLPNNNGYTEEELRSSIQIEKGSQTSYESYKSQTYEINLGKNLFDKNNANTYAGYINTNGIITSNSPDKMIYIPCKPNTTYTLQKMLQGTTSYNRFRVGSSTEIPTANLVVSDTFLYLDGTTETTMTFTTSINAQYLIFYCYRTDTETTFEEMLDSIQIEEGSQATSYSAYKTPIELCKIGNYQDYIRKGTGKNLLANNTTTQTINNVTFTKNNDGSEKVSGTASARTDLYFVGTSSEYVDLGLKEGTYTLSGCASGGSSSSYGLFIVIQHSNETTNIYADYGESITVSVANGDKFRIFIRIANGTNVNVTFFPQLERNSTKTLFEPYGYKDKWYIYKAIDKIVLDGSENWVKHGSIASWFYYDGITNGYVLDNTQVLIKTNYYTPKAYQGVPNLVNGECSYGSSDGGITHRFVIKNTDYTQTQDFKTWLSTHNTMLYYVLATPTTTEITDTELINQLNAVELYNGINNILVSGYLPSPLQLHYNYVIEEDISDLLFCGVVKNSGYISLNPRHPHYQTLQILDFKTFLSEGETLDFVIADKTIEEAIEQVISTIAPYGFIKGNIQLLNADEVIGAYSTKDKTAYDVFNYVADITQSRWKTRLIDENTVAIDFYDPTLLPEGSSIDYTQSYFEENLIDDISYSYGANDYRNKQVMTSSEVYGSILQTQTIVANGYQTQFDTELKIGKISSITINGVQMSFATNQEKELGYTADFYYTPGNNYFESADLRSTGQIIIISYLAIVEGRQIITNGTEIDRVATSTGRKGVVARYEDRNDATTSLELQLIGQSYIKYKGVPEIKLNVTTRKNLWNIGDRVTFNAPITELATEYMVKKKEIQRVFANPSSEEVIFYKFELSSSFNMEQAINYFDNQRAKAKGNIGEGEYISRNVDIENIANVIFYDGTCEEVTIDGDNTLNSVLNSPFIN